MKPPSECWPWLAPQQRSLPQLLGRARSLVQVASVPRPRRLPLSIDRSLEVSISEGALVVGVDEAGRGAWAGPVVAAAVLVAPGAQGLEEGVTDSKRLSPGQREWVFEQLISNPDVHYGVAEVGERRIDEVNILSATYEAMSQAFRNMPPASTWCPTCSGCQRCRLRVLVDGNRVPPAWKEQQSCTSVVKGDAKILAVAAASIIAKVTRDRSMLSLDKRYPAYSFGRHKGYGTKHHRMQLESHGHCEAHRRSFNPLKTYLRTHEWRASFTSRD